MSSTSALMKNPRLTMEVTAIGQITFYPQWQYKPHLHRPTESDGWLWYPLKVLWGIVWNRLFPRWTKVVIPVGTKVKIFDPPAEIQYGKYRAGRVFDALIKPENQFQFGEDILPLISLGDGTAIELLSLPPIG